MDHAGRALKFPKCFNLMQYYIINTFVPIVLYYSDNALVLEVFLQVVVIATWSYLELSAGSEEVWLVLFFPLVGNFSQSDSETSELCEVEDMTLALNAGVDTHSTHQCRTVILSQFVEDQTYTSLSADTAVATELKNGHTYITFSGFKSL